MMKGARRSGGPFGDSRYPAQPVQRAAAPISHPGAIFVRSSAAAVASLALLAATAGAQLRDTTFHDKTFLTRRDLLVSGLALGATALVSIFDGDIARGSQQPNWKDSSKHRFALRGSKGKET